jgi:uncharacterized tellurite resistance protein B-like protein
MFERFLSFLTDMPSHGEDKTDDPRVAAAALLFHIMDADGVRQDVERERIRALLAETYDLTGQSLDQLLKAGEEADSAAIDLYAFTSVLKRHLDEEGRAHFIELMWEICYADGDLHELEDNTLWRTAELLGVDRRARVEARQAVRRRTVPGSVN